MKEKANYNSADQELAKSTRFKKGEKPPPVRSPKRSTQNIWGGGGAVEGFVRHTAVTAGAKRGKKEGARKDQQCLKKHGKNGCKGGKVGGKSDQNGWKEGTGEDAASHRPRNRTVVPRQPY